MRLGQALEAALRDDIPRSVKQICRDCGVREEFVLKHFPEIKEKLRMRYVQWLEVERERKQRDFESAVCTAVGVLRDSDLYPSVGMVVSINASLKSAGWERLTRAIGMAIERLGGDRDG
jgi:hypothetical protein